MELYTSLTDLGIVYEEIEHEPVYTAKEAQFIKSSISGIGCKNLFLTDNRRTKYLLVILEESRFKANCNDCRNITFVFCRQG